MDREAWRAVIHGVSKNRTRLCDWSDLIWSVVGLLWGNTGTLFRLYLFFHPTGWNVDLMAGAGAAILKHKVVLKLEPVFGIAVRKRSLNLWDLCGIVLGCLSPDFYISVLIKGFCFRFLFLFAKPNSSRFKWSGPHLPNTECYSPETTTCCSSAISSCIYIQKPHCWTHSLVFLVYLYIWFYTWSVDFLL